MLRHAHLLRIATEPANVLLNELESSSLVLQSDVEILNGNMLTSKLDGTMSTYNR